MTGISGLTSLRTLELGSNRIRHIEQLDAMTGLQVRKICQIFRIYTSQKNEKNVDEHHVVSSR